MFSPPHLVRLASPGDWLSLAGGGGRTCHQPRSSLCCGHLVIPLILDEQVQHLSRFFVLFFCRASWWRSRNRTVKQLGNFAKLPKRIPQMRPGRDEIGPSPKGVRASEDKLSLRRVACAGAMEDRSGYEVSPTAAEAMRRSIDSEVRVRRRSEPALVAAEPCLARANRPRQVIGRVHTR